MTGSPLPKPRKRSRGVTLSAVGSAAMLAACEAGVDRVAAPDFGPQTQVAAFQTVAECTATGQYTLDQCTTAQRTAAASDDSQAPRFDQRQTCEEQFGEGNCVPRGSGSYFSPLLTGFLIGQALNGGGYRYSPLYRDRRDGGYYTGSGGRLIGSNGRYSVGARALEPVTTQRIQTRSSVVSRGGFGGRATSRGGWGGSRGFGG